MRVVTAPETFEKNHGEVSVFLAGGIQKTEKWQNKVISSLSERFKNDRVVVLNPRRDNFPINDKTESFRQISWEFGALESADVFTMFFAGGESDQPICMFEYGKHLERRMAEKDLGRLVVSSDEGYKRLVDVVVQTSLAAESVRVNRGLENHIRKIIKVVEKELERLKS